MANGYLLKVEHVIAAVIRVFVFHLALCYPYVRHHGVPIGDRTLELRARVVKLPRSGRMLELVFKLNSDDRASVPVKQPA